jgi:2-hydroxychromene-2-carboxylate isomerase
MNALASTSSPSPASADGLPHRAPDSDVALSLVSHTNAGKTTLARTLLREDVGEVRDAPHVTEFAEVRTMIATPAGERLLLWDTPGFGDSVRLAKRLRQSSQPLGWFLSQVWDRWRDRPFWATQQAMRNLRDEADAMLYLVNAAESPEAAGYVGPEMELLAWIGKPVIVLLNQLGPPGEPALEQAELARWRSHLASHAAVRAVLPLDAFARCWVQEATLLGAVESALDGERQARMARLRAAWRQRQLGVFDAAMRILAGGLAHVALDAVALEERAASVRSCAASARSSAWQGRRFARRARAGDARAAARRAGARRHAGADPPARSRRQRRRRILARLATHYQLRLRLDEGHAALWGGVVSGALVGLKADLLSGGLTLGGGLLAGGLLGALGSAGLARCVNLVRGTDRRGCRGTARRSMRSSRRRCCATSRSRTSVAAAATGPKASRRRTGRTSSRRRSARIARRSRRSGAAAGAGCRREPGRRRGARSRPGGAAGGARADRPRRRARDAAPALSGCRRRLEALLAVVPPCSRRARRASLPTMPGPPTAIEFYFDFSSPYSYFASEWIEALAARHGRTVRWKAILLGVTFQAAELKSPVHHPLKREYTLHDFERSARYAGVPYKLPIRSRSRRRTRRASSGGSTSSAPRRAGVGTALPSRLLHPQREPRRHGVAEGAGRPSSGSTPTRPRRYGRPRRRRRGCARSATTRSRTACSGRPSFVVDGEPFWGNDRRAQIERWLQGGSFQATAHDDL